MNRWKIDQAVVGVSYVDDSPRKGAIITIRNNEKMPMPVLIEITEGRKTPELVRLPVEIWQHGDTWKFRYNSSGKITSIKIDPQGKMPDINRGNNQWKPENPN